MLKTFANALQAHMILMKILNILNAEKKQLILKNAKIVIKNVKHAKQLQIIVLIVKINLLEKLLQIVLAKKDMDKILNQPNIHFATHVQ